MKSNLPPIALKERHLIAGSLSIMTYLRHFPCPWWNQSLALLTSVTATERLCQQQAACVQSHTLEDLGAAPSICSAFITKHLHMSRSGGPIYIRWTIRHRCWRKVDWCLTSVTGACTVIKSIKAPTPKRWTDSEIHTHKLRDNRRGTNQLCGKRKPETVVITKIVSAKDSARGVAHSS